MEKRSQMHERLLRNPVLKMNVVIASWESEATQRHDERRRRSIFAYDFLAMRLKHTNALTPGY